MPIVSRSENSRNEISEVCEKSSKETSRNEISEVSGKSSEVTSRNRIEAQHQPTYRKDYEENETSKATPLPKVKLNKFHTALYRLVEDKEITGVQSESGRVEKERNRKELTNPWDSSSKYSSKI